MGELADKRLGDLLPTVDAYRPVALTVAAILGLVALLPGAQSDSAPPVAELSSASATASDATAPPTTTAPPTSAPAPDPTSSPTTLAPSGTEVAAPPPPPSRTSSPTTEPTSPPTTAAFASDFGDEDEDEDEEAEPLRIAEFGWASTTGGTLVPTAEAETVPEGTMPVGNRVGQVDKISFVRLTGDETELVLAEEAAGRRGSAFEASPVDVCRITDGSWEPGPDQAMSDAPEYDAEDCVAAQQRSDGTWAIGLFLFEDPTDDRGFALVPSADAPLDFQVTFAGQAVT